MRGAIIIVGLITFVGTLSCCSCATTLSPELKDLRFHIAYDDLSNEERDVLEDIASDAIDSPRKQYYFNRLHALLDVATSPPSVTRRMNNEEIDRSVEESKQTRRRIAKDSKQDLEDYMSREEVYEQSKEREWMGYRPTWDSPYFYVSHEIYTDILVHIRVKLSGNEVLIKKILSFEDAIEKHLTIDGFSVNLSFVGHSDNDVFEVTIDPGAWATSHNWSGGFRVIAHELMHLMGLPDEYDRIEMHHNNKHVTRIQRLLMFREQMSKELPANAISGIMCYHGRKPLQRHVCAAVGESEECIQARNTAYNK